MLRYSLVAVLVVGLLVAATPALAATEAPGFGPQLQLQQMTKEQVRQQLREMHTELKGTCEQFQTRLSEQEHAQLEEHLLLMRRLSWADDFEPGQINSLALKLAAMVGQEADDDTLDGEDDDGIDEAGSGVLAIAARLHLFRCACYRSQASLHGGRTGRSGASLRAGHSAQPLPDGAFTRTTVKPGPRTVKTA